MATIKSMNKKQHDFLDISIQLSDFQKWYLTRDQITGKRFAILERGTDKHISDFGTKEEILFFLKGYRKAIDHAYAGK